MHTETRLKITAAWAEQLSVKLGRSVEDIRKHGLNAGDFPSDHELRVEFDDGSFAQFAYAFHVVSEDGYSVAIFTEHCGYYVFSAISLVIMRLKKEVCFQG